MRKLSQRNQARRILAKKVGLFFLAASSVYSGPVAIAAQTSSAEQVRESGGTTLPGSKMPETRPPELRPPAARPPALIPPASRPPTRPAADPFADSGAGSGAGSGVDGTAPAPTVLETQRAGKPVSPEDVSYNADVGTVEIHVSDAELVEVLRMLSLQSRKNIVASKEVKGTITANLYGVTVREALDAILHSNGYAYREEGNFVYVYTAQEIQQQEEAKRVRKSEVFRLNYTPAVDVVKILKQVLGDGSRIEQMSPSQAGVSTNSDTTGNTYATAELVVVTDFEEKIEEARRIIAEIDKRPQQVLVEATIVTARLDDTNQLGVDFSVLGGIDFSTLQFGQNGASGPGLTSNIPGNTTASSTSGDLASRGYASISTGGSGLRMGVVKDNIGIFLTALEQNTNTTVLANPKVLVSNRHQGRVQVGQRLGYRDATTIGSGGESTVGSVNFLDTGTILSFRPFIGDDGFIRMEVRPEQSDGIIDAETQVPTASTANITTNIVVRDGHTVVIGGLFRDRSERIRNQVPGLGNVPGVGALFRRQNDSALREEIIVLLTPHIIKDDAVYSEESLKALDRLESMRVGLRRGLMPWGRERLSESFYDRATRELAKPNPNKSSVLFNLNAATNLNPTFVEATDLKRQVTGRVVTSIDSSATRRFVRELIKAESQQPGAPAVQQNAIIPMPLSTSGATTRPISSDVKLKRENAGAISRSASRAALRSAIRISSAHVFRSVTTLAEDGLVAMNDSVAWMAIDRLIEPAAPQRFKASPQPAKPTVVQIDVR